MKIYTKTGDKGTTALVGGTRVSKAHPRVEAYGSVDELISYIGVIRAYKIDGALQKELHGIQECLMVGAALLASDEQTAKKLPCISKEDVIHLEKMIDELDGKLPKLRFFVIPAGPLQAAAAHVARSVCRRAERAVIVLETAYFIPKIVLEYLNRLSDYLFMLARYLTVESGIPEETWVPKK